MDENRRMVIRAGAAIGLAGLLGVTPGRAADVSGAPQFDPIPPLPVTPTPGKPGDFDFLSGEWRIQHVFLRGNAWDRFEGAATVTPIHKGLGSVEELRIPARDFNGMGLRLLDVEKRVWSDFWVNAKSGVLSTPGQTGSFENGAGIFVSDDEMDGKPMKTAGIWDKITPRSCRWRQATSMDGGKTWSQSWIMDWTRV